METRIKKEETLVKLAFLSICIIWGSTYLAIRIGVSDFPPALFAGIRFTTAGILMLGYAKLNKLKMPDTFTEVRRISIVGLFLILCGNGFVVWAEQTVHSGIASVIVATVPLFMALIELMLPSHKNIGLKGWVGLLVGFAGVTLLVFSNSGGGYVDFKGIALLLAGALLWAVGSVYSKSFKTTCSTVANIGIEMLAGGIALLIVGVATGQVLSIHFTPSTIGSMLYLIIFGSILGYSSYIYVLQKWPTAKAGTYAYVNPPVAVFLGAIVLNEKITAGVVLSTVVILAGVVLVQTSKAKSSEK